MMSVVHGYIIFLLLLAILSIGIGVYSEVKIRNGKKGK